MFLKSFKPAVSAMKISRFALVAAIAVTSLTGLWLAGVPTGYASDLDTPMSADASGANFLRIGLNKSVVLRLPADAKDVLVGNPDIVDAVVRTRNTAYLFARAVGQTNIFFFDANGQQILNLDIEVAQDMTALQKLIKRTLPGSRITVDMIGNNVILGGIAATPAEAKTAEDLAKRFGGDVLNTIKVATESQVMLKVRIAEVQRDVLKKLGVNFSQLAFDAGKFAFSLPMTNTFPNVTSTSLKGTVGYAGNNLSANASIEALEGTGLLRTLAEPNLTAVSGQPAKFHAGGEYPYSTCDRNGICSIEFKPYGVSLEFTPIVMDAGRINLKIRTEVSELASLPVGAAAGSPPPVNTRNAETTLELPSGGAMMLAGLIKDSVRQNINGTPGLKELPVLGNLFRSRDYVQNETEMVVIVTPFIVGAAGQSDLAMPTDGLNAPTDGQALMWGRLNKLYGAPGGTQTGTYTGSVGHIVE